MNLGQSPKVKYSPEAKRKAAAVLELRRRQVQAGRPMLFRDFIAQANPRYLFYRHCQELISVLQRVANGEINRLMIFMPPRHSKSETVSRLFSAYYLSLHPDRFVGLASYGADLAYTLSRVSRDNYQRIGGQIRSDAGAVKHWETTDGGALWAAGVGGPITGKGFHLGIIDDPIKDAEEASSETIRAKQKDWYGSTFSTRMEPDAQVIVLQTRWHQDDLSGYLLTLEQDEPEGWYILSMPAIAEAPPPFPVSCTVHPDWRTEGQALCPERYPIDRLEKVQHRIGEYFFGALFQQRPRPRSGGMFRREDFTSYVDRAPQAARRVRYWDTAGADVGKGDFTAGGLVALTPDGTVYIEDMVRGQWPAAARNALIRQTAEADRYRGDVRIYIEQPPGLAKESTDAIIQALIGFPAFADPVRGDKVSRAEPFAAQCQAGNVVIVRGAWNKAFLDELEAFPNGKNDDQVDTGSGAFGKLIAWLDPRAAQSHSLRTY